MKARNFELIEVLHQFPKQEGAVYRKELCIVDWFGKGLKYDIRGWNDDHTKMTKGISMRNSGSWWKQQSRFYIRRLAIERERVNCGWTIQRSDKQIFRIIQGTAEEQRLDAPLQL